MVNFSLIFSAHQSISSFSYYRRTVYDPQTGQDVVLSNEDVEHIKNVMGSKIPDGSYDPYKPWVEWFTSEVRETPVTSAPEHKRSFIPSRIEAVKGNFKSSSSYHFSIICINSLIDGTRIDFQIIIHSRFSSIWFHLLQLFCPVNI